MLAAIFILLSIIFLHELGHWFVARLWKFRTPVLSVGIGPTLFKFNWRDTEWRLCLLPLGGYVEIPQIARSYRVAFHFSRPHQPFVSYVPKKEADGTELPSATGFQRVAIAAAGPLVNLIIGIALLLVLLYCKTPVPTALDSSTVGFPIPGAIRYASDSPAQLQAGDVLQRPEYTSRRTDLLKSSSLNLTKLSTYHYKSLRISRPDGKGSTQELEVHAKLAPAYGPYGYASLPVLPLEPVLVKQVNDTSAEGRTAKSVAAIAQLKPGDEWISLNGVRISSPAELAYQLRSLAGKPDPVTARILRNSSELTASFIVPALPDRSALPAWLGFTVETQVTPHSLIAVDLLSVDGLLSDIQQEIAIEPQGTEQNRGTLGLMEMVRDTTERRGIAGLLFIAMIANLGIMVFNLFPIPPLDGSRILEGGIEMATRKPVAAALTLWKDLFAAGFAITLLLSMFFRDAREMGHAALRQMIPGPELRTTATNAPSITPTPPLVETNSPDSLPNLASTNEETSNPGKGNIRDKASETLRADIAWLRDADVVMRGRALPKESAQ
ncbi:MAG: site-2 protease family protein [Candidatus Methylacidiphilales bacterium]|nr:site-2 protease family protein [Candidatus Methylacidiphilales bacterium]